MLMVVSAGGGRGGWCQVWGQRFSRLGAHLFQAHSRFDLKVAHFSIQYWYLPPGEVYFIGYINSGEL
jgi:hypothetical protein